MRSTLFISGKNWQLSLAEIAAHLNARELKYYVNSFSKEFFVIDITQDKPYSDIESLGGTIKIGEAKTRVPTQIVRNAFLEKDKQAQILIALSLTTSGLIDGIAKSTKKTLFGVSIYCSDNALRPLSSAIQRFLGSTVKNGLACFGLKSKFMGFSKQRKLAQLSHVEVLKKKLVETRAEVLFCVGKDESWVGTTIAVHNPFEFQKRDIYKPYQRRIFAMPPRLARIMVNLSSCSSGKVLLDPFCGVGTILQEALLAKARVVGVDANAWCVRAANENLEWLTREYNLESTDFRVLQGDVSKLTQKIGQEMVDCVVSEPDLGPALRQVPTGPYAQKIIQKLEPLYFGFIEEASRVLRKTGRLVLVTPYIMTRSGQIVRMPIGVKLEHVGFKRVQPFMQEMFTKKDKRVESLLNLNSLVEIDERHLIGREIHIYQKEY